MQPLTFLEQYQFLKLTKLANQFAKYIFFEFTNLLISNRLAWIPAYQNNEEENTAPKTKGFPIFLFAM